jgi:hypothetical protein
MWSTMMPAFLRIVSILLVMSGVAISAAAQTPHDANPWGYGTTLGLFGGASIAGSDAGPQVGGAIGWEIEPWFAIEGRAAWENGVGDADAFSANLAARVDVLTDRALVPFGKIGVGLYHASFDDPDRAPTFYRHRMAVDRTPLGVSRSFTDPSLVIGAGLNVFTSRHLALRPEFETAFVFRDSDTRAVVSFTLQIAYHFEDHPVTP